MCKVWKSSGHLGKFPPPLITFSQQANHFAGLEMGGMKSAEFFAGIWLHMRATLSRTNVWKKLSLRFPIFYLKSQCRCTSGLETVEIYPHCDDSKSNPKYTHGLRGGSQGLTTRTASAFPIHPRTIR